MKFNHYAIPFHSKLWDKQTISHYNRPNRLDMHLKFIAVLIICISLPDCGGSSDKTTVSTKNPTTTSTNYIYQVPKNNNDGWNVGDIQDQSIKLNFLASMMNAIHRGTYTKIDSILIVRNNTLVFDELIRTKLDDRDQFIENTNLRVHSMQSTTKSFASALIGIAIDKGYINSVNQTFYNSFTEYNSFDNWDARKGQITLQNILTMRHGLLWDEWNTDYSDASNSLGSTYRNSNDYVKHLLDLPIDSKPGTTFAYSTIASVALGAFVENNSAMQLEDFADTYLFNPLGITSHRWSFTPVGRAHTGGGLWLSGRDMLKFGQLYLNSGSWNGQQIISQVWVDESLKRRVHLNFSYSDGYGYQWWSKDYNIAGQGMVETFFTAGNGGQFIYLIPSKDAVVALTGGNYESPLMYQADTLMQQYIIPALD